MTDEEQMHHEKPTRKRGKRRTRAHGTGSIFRRPERRSKPWVAQIILDNGKTRQRYFHTQEEAATALNEMLYEQRQGRLVAGPRQTVGQYLEYWLEIHRAGLKLSTYAVYRRHLRNHLIPGLGQYQLQSLTVDQVQALYDRKQQEGMAPATIRYLHRILSAALKDAVKWKRLSFNVCEYVTLPRLSKQTMHALDQEQAKQLLAVAKGGRFECLLTLALVTGMRLGELLALRWSDINFEREWLQVCHTVAYIQGFGLVETEPKTDSSRRTLVLPQVALTALKQHRATQLETRLTMGTAWHDQGLVFTNQCGGYLNRGWVQKTFKKLLTQAKLPPMRFHDLRHSAATLLLSMGVNAKVVQEILGHANLSITLGIYAHALPTMHREAMGGMDTLFGG